MGALEDATFGFLPADDKLTESTNASTISRECGRLVMHLQLQSSSLL